MSLRRCLHRVNRYAFRKVTALSALSGTLVITLWLSRGDKNSYFHAWETAKTAVHREIDRWHLSGDPQSLPRLSPLASPRWRGYESDRLHEWSEPASLDEDNDEQHLGLRRPGDQGSPVEIPADKEAEAARMSVKYHINLVASDMIPLDRTLKDYRNPSCLMKQYPRRLPRTSVIVVFNNEAKSTLLRTVHSVINRSPRNLLEEIILVDDDSGLEELGKSLDDLVSELLVPTRVLRLKSRMGLIRARLSGSREAKGSVLVFLDAHVEVTTGWLVAMLSEIAGDRTRVVMPVIDEISYKTFRYRPIDNDHDRGGFDWKLFHYWIGPADVTVGSRWVIGQKDTDAFPSPTMIGCAFAIDREFFFALGSYDSGMSIWGGENVELSVRTWRCGGSLLKVPCARVGHIYRAASPHSVPGGARAKLETAVVNTARFVEAWLEPPYTNFYYFMNPSAKSLELGNLSDRVSLSKELKCHSFQWFLDYVYTDNGFPVGQPFFGQSLQIQEVNSGLCLDALSTRGPAGMRLCHGLGGYQSILFTVRGELRSASRCLEPDMLQKETSNQTFNVTFITCDTSANQTWTFRKDNSHEDNRGSWVHNTSGLCLSFNRESNGNLASAAPPKKVLNYLANVMKDIARTIEAPVLQECDSNDKTVGQRWVLRAREDWQTVDRIRTTIK